MERIVNMITSISNWNALELLPEVINGVEIRADILEDVMEKAEMCSLPWIYVLRSKASGGYFNGSFHERKLRLKKAAQRYDFVELEGATDLIPEILDVIPVHKRRIAWYGNYSTYNALRQQLEAYLKVEAQVYKVIVETQDHKETVAVTHLVKAFNSKPVIAYAVGEFARWSQVIAPFLGAPEVHTDLSGEELYAPEQLVGSFGLPEVYKVEQLFGIVGNPVANSVSPKLHNEAYRTLNLPFLYLPFHADSFDAFKHQLLQNSAFPIPLHGLTVVSPFKTEGYEFSNKRNPSKKETVEVCNGLVKEEGLWQSFSTDAYGALEALSLVSDWEQKRIAIIGVGGTGKSIAETLKAQQVEVTLVNRTESHGRQIAGQLGLPFVSLKQFDPQYFDIVIHATPLGKRKGEIPFDLNQIQAHSLMIDHVYPKYDKTELVKYCELFNIQVVDGQQIARIQIRKQFEAMTGILFPEGINTHTLQHLKTN